MHKVTDLNRMTLVMSDLDIVDQLRSLRESFEKDAGSGLSDFAVPAVLLLADVCDALGRSISERNQVLGVRWTA